jgi:hypothetical protein
MLDIGIPPTMASHLSHFLGVGPGCDARVKGNTSYSIGDHTFYQPKKCDNPAKKKMSVDDGQAHLNICDTCLPVFLKRKEWLGFFDCALPGKADVVGSKHYYDTVLEVYREEHLDSNPSPGVLRKWIEDLVKEGENEDFGSMPNPSFAEERKEEIQKELEEINKKIPESRSVFSEFLRLIKQKMELEKELKSL